MNRQNRAKLYRSIRVALKEDASFTTLQELLKSLPNDSEKSKYFLIKLSAKISGG